ncbi:MAG: TIGR03086 family metal-binding protein [Acidimicrobiales bacterium]
MEPTRQLSVILPVVCDLVDGIRPDQLDEPTPCSEFTVHDVLAHMVGLGGAFSHWFRGEDAPPAPPRPLDGRVPAEEFRSTMDALLESVRSPGALDRTIVAPVGEMQGGVFARLVAFDGLVHGWDLAVATGQAFDLPPDVVTAVDRFSQMALTAEMRDGDTFKDATAPPSDANGIERIAAFSGRSV